MSRIVYTGERDFTGVGGRVKRPRIKMPAYLDFIRSLPCVISGRTPVDPAHVSYPCLDLGKRARGRGEKADDRWTLPLSRGLHDEQEVRGEEAFWAHYGINPLILCLALLGTYYDKDHDAALHVLRNAGRLIVRK